MSFDARVRDGLDRAAGSLDPDVDGSLQSVLTRRRHRVRVRQAGLVLATAATVAVSVLGVRLALGPASDEEASQVDRRPQVSVDGNRYLSDQFIPPVEVTTPVWLSPAPDLDEPTMLSWVGKAGTSIGLSVSWCRWSSTSPVLRPRLQRQRTT